MTKKSNRRGEIVAPTSYAAQVIRQQAAAVKAARLRDKAFADLKVAVLEDMSQMFDGDMWDELHNDVRDRLAECHTTEDVVSVVAGVLDSMSTAEAAQLVLTSAFGR